MSEAHVAIESFEITLLQRVRDALQDRNVPPDTALHRCLQELAHGCRADHAVLAILGHDARVQVRIGVGLTHEQIARSCDGPGDVIGRVLATGLPIAAENAGVDLVDAWPFCVEGVRRYLCVPVILRSAGVIGALGVDRCRPDAPWMPDDLRLPTVVAALIATHVAALRVRHDETASAHHAPPADVRSSNGTRILGDSPQTQNLRRLISHAAGSVRPVLIEGEHGVGKALAAQEIHAQSDRCDQPLTTVSCAALVGPTADMELFGHTKGSLSGAGFARRGHFGQAEGGTLFLDEIHQLSLPLQAKLMRVLRDGAMQRVGSDIPQPTNVRVVVSTHVDLKAAVRTRTFRDDLQRELDTTRILISPLRDRPSDIVALTGHFCETLSQVHRCAPRRMSSSALTALLNHSWPGNVSELQSVILRALLIARGPSIEVDDLPRSVRSSAERDAPAIDNLEQQLSKFERETILEAMRNADGNHAKAAHALQTTPRILAYRLRRLGTDVSDL